MNQRTVGALEYPRGKADMGIEITVNGDLHEVQARTVGAALDELGFGNRASAAELNGDAVVAISQHDTEINHGDTIEFVQLVGGG